jgi:hypothetical protein
MFTCFYEFSFFSSTLERLCEMLHSMATYINEKGSHIDGFDAFSGLFNEKYMSKKDDHQEEIPRYVASEYV